jgi:lipopolysaccharide/colanic/teichoic acid biosynthesis glycosyltransferase
MYKKIIKPLVDFIFSFLGVLILLPVLLVFTILLLFFNSGQPFFKQIRPGEHGKLFTLIKFRTMNNKKDKNGDLLHDKYRLTKLGKLIRTTSLDELPQLINVLKGDMSFIGPRPLLIKYLPLYSERQSRRHEVKPGITGWAQVNGRNTISWQEKFEFDVWYVDNISFKTDIKILFLTIIKVLRRSDISSTSSVTMEAFKGNED